IKAANALQDKIASQQENAGKFEIPDWDEPSLKKVRDAIKKIGGTPPENLPPAEHIKQVAKRIAAAPPKLQLEAKDAKGLAGGREAGEGRT
ncbi:MAG: hypothetical protein NT049_10215, partial [Planctomycetota bacterium]|nr:hypothetical protein [Planctomycetota bacterium]